MTRRTNPKFQRQQLLSWEKMFTNHKEVDESSTPKKTLLRGNEDEKRQNSNGPFKRTSCAETESTIKTTADAVCHKSDTAVAKIKKIKLSEEPKQSSSKSPNNEPQSTPKNWVVKSDAEKESLLRWQRGATNTNFYNKNVQNSQSYLISREKKLKGRINLSIKRSKPHTSDPNPLGARTQDEANMKQLS